MTKVTTITLSDELARRVEGLAAMLDRPQAWVIEQAILRYVEQEEGPVRAIREAVDELHAELATGHVAGRDFEEVMDELEAKLKKKLSLQDD